MALAMQPPLCHSNFFDAVYKQHVPAFEEFATNSNLEFK